MVINVKYSTNNSEHTLRALGDDPKLATIHSIGTSFEHAETEIIKAFVEYFHSVYNIKIRHEEIVLKVFDEQVLSKK